MRTLQNYDGREVIDSTGQRIGTVERTYDDPTGEPRLVEVSMGHLLGKEHRLVPVDTGSLIDQGLQVLYSKDAIDNSPDASSAGDALDGTLYTQVQEYYADQRTSASNQSGPNSNGSGSATSQENVSMNTTTVAPVQLMNYDLMDNQGNKIGSIDGVWTDPTSGDLSFLGVKTIPLVGKTYVVPASQAQIDSNNHTVTVPYTQDAIKNAPTYDTSKQISPSMMASIESYYQEAQSQGGTGAGAVPVTNGNGSSGSNGIANFPVDDLTYDLYTLISEKLEGLEAYAEYIDDASDDQNVAQLFQQLSQQDAQGIEQLQQALVTRLTSQQQGN
ncbi:MAG: PRC-barrel domain-containing protein [Chloroflexota bacterium]